MTHRVKVAVTGAAGQIGYALLFRIASGQMFGPDTKVELRLLELPHSLSSLEGVKMELADCAFPLLEKVVCTADVKEAMDGVNWALLVGAVPRKQGMERADLLQTNAAIFKEQGRAIGECAAKDVRVFVVGNPCNTNALIAAHHAKGVPASRFYCMTTLDELRARTQLAEKASVGVDAINRMIIWGNHSATQYPDITHAQINDRAATDIVTDNTWIEDVFIPTVQQRGAAVIKARGASSAGSAANAIIGAVHRLVTPQFDDWFSMGVCSRGEYGVDEGLMFSLPCKWEKGEIKVIEGLSFSEAGKARFEQTLAELCQERDTVKSLGLLD